jgi:replication-associated recombination protein RarA
VTRKSGTAIRRRARNSRKAIREIPKAGPRANAIWPTVLEKTLQEKVVINENGRRKTITKLEAAVKQLVNKAASGDLRALHHLTALARSADERSPEAPIAPSVMAEVDQKVLQGIFSRFEKDSNGGEDAEPHG